MPRLVLLFLGYIFLPLGRSMGNHLDQFSLPIFDEHGTKFCNIYGQRANLSEDKTFEISNISIQTFPESEKNFPSLSVTSNQAKVNPFENSASGDGFIAITNGEFSATGEKWEFSGGSKNFILNENVQVFFEKPPPHGE